MPRAALKPGAPGRRTGFGDSGAQLVLAEKVDRGGHGDRRAMTLVTQANAKHPASMVNFPPSVPLRQSISRSGVSLLRASRCHLCTRLGDTGEALTGPLDTGQQGPSEAVSLPGTTLDKRQMRDLSSSGSGPQSPTVFQLESEKKLPAEGFEAPCPPWRMEGRAGMQDGGGR